jgi:hypothetical protein
MAYRETRRWCRVCGRETVHWRAWNEWRQAPPPEGWLGSMVTFLRTVRKNLSWRWRCLECDHPWESSLLNRESPRQQTGR